MNIFGVVGNYQPIRAYLYYNHARLQTNYWQYTSQFPMVFDYNKSGDTYVSLNTSWTTIIDYGDLLGNLLTLDESWDLWNSGFRWVAIRLWTNQTKWNSSSNTRYLWFRAIWTSTTSGEHRAVMNNQSISLRLTGGVGDGINGHYEGVTWFPLSGEWMDDMWFWSSMTVEVRRSSYGGLDFSLSGGELYWTMDQNLT